jgi:hypothetical protein
MKRYSICAVLICVLFSILSGCGNSTPLSVSQLASQSEKYNGKTVTAEGFYFEAFEMMAVCEALKPSTVNPGSLAPQGTLIWLEGGIPKIHDRLYTNPQDAASGYPEHYGKVRVKGKFQSGGQFGHLGAYQFQITVSEAQLLDWTPTIQSK